MLGKKSYIHIILSVFIFLIVMRLVPSFWKDYYQYYPEQYTQYRLKQLVKDNSRLIDDVLRICERSKTDDNLVYCLDALAEYGVWFEKYKHIVKEKSELKESVIRKLKEASKIRPEEDDFNTYLKELE